MGLADQLDHAVEALESAGKIDHRTALFGEGRGRQDEVSLIGGRVGQHARLHEEIEFLEIVRGEASVGDEIFAQNDQRFDRAIANAVADRIELGVGIFRFENQLGARGVRVAVGSHEQGVGLGKARDERDLAGADFGGERAGEE